MSTLRKMFYALALAVLVFALDRLSKHIILLSLDHEGSVMTVSSFFDLVLVFNKGISFGLLNTGHDFMPYVLMGVAGVVILSLILWLVRGPCLLVALAIGLVIGGAVGNLYDRVTYGAVIDFLSFHLGALEWPAFNIADSAIVGGVLLLFLQSLVFDKKERVSSP